MTGGKLEILRKVDAVVLEEIRNAGLYGAIWHLCRGVAGPECERAWRRPLLCFVCALRAVTRPTASDYLPFPHEFLGRTATRIINKSAASTASSTTSPRNRPEQSSASRRKSAAIS